MNKPPVSKDINHRRFSSSKVIDIEKKEAVSIKGRRNSQNIQRKSEPQINNVASRNIVSQGNPIVSPAKRNTPLRDALIASGRKTPLKDTFMNESPVLSTKSPSKQRGNKRPSLPNNSLINLNRINSPTYSSSKEKKFSHRVWESPQEKTPSPQNNQKSPSFAKRQSSLNNSKDRESPSKRKSISNHFNNESALNLTPSRKRKNLSEASPQQEIRIADLNIQNGDEILESGSINSTPPSKLQVLSNRLQTMSSESKLKRKSLPNLEVSPKDYKRLVANVTSSPPQWNNYLPENNIDELNEKIITIEKELNRLYKKKKGILQTEGKKDEGPINLPIEQRLKRLYSLLPHSTQKIWNQTSAPGGIVEKRQPILSEYHYSHITTVQNNIRMIIQKQNYKKKLIENKKSLDKLRQEFFEVERILENELNQDILNIKKSIQIENNIESIRNDINNFDDSETISDIYDIKKEQDLNNEIHSEINYNENIDRYDNSYNEHIEKVNYELNIVDFENNLSENNEIIENESLDIFLANNENVNHNFSEKIVYIENNPSENKIENLENDELIENIENEISESYEPNYNYIEYDQKINDIKEDIVDLDKYVIIIQRNYKRYKFNKHIHQSYEARKIQKWWKRYIFSNKNTYINSIEDSNHPIKENILSNELNQTNLEEEISIDQEEIETFAFKIQRAYKKYKLRKYLKESYASRRIQQTWKRYKMFIASY